MWRLQHPARLIVGAAAVAAAALALNFSGCGEPTEAELLDAARAAIAKRETQAAVLSLKALLQVNPEAAEGRFLLGKLLLAAGEMPAAEAELRRALSARHPEVEVLPLLAQAMLSQGSGAQLLQQFGKTDLPDPQADADLKSQLAAAAADTGDLVQAQALIDSARRRAVDPTAADIQQARLSALRGDMALALSQTNAVLAAKPDNALALALRGDLLARRGPQMDLGAAVTSWRQSLAIKPDDALVHASVLAVLTGQNDWAGAQTQWRALQKVAPRHVQTLYYEALIEAQKGNFTRTRELSQLLLRRVAGDLRVLMLAGRAEFKLGGMAQAEALFTRAMQAAPALPAPRQALAQVLLRTGQVDRAMAILKPLLEADPPDLEAMLTAAYAHLQTGDTARANALYERAARISPSDPRVRTATALTKLAKGQHATARAELRAIAASDPGSAADLALINSSMRLGAVDDALQAIDKLAAKLPDDPQPHVLRARIALQRKDFAAARKSFGEALQRSPDHMPSLMGLTTLDLLERRPADAKARLEAVVQRNAKHVGAMVTLAELNDRTAGPADETQRWYRAAVKASPGDVGPHLKLIDHLMQANQIVQAKEAALAAVALFPNDEDVLDRVGRSHLLQGDALQAVATFRKWVRLSGGSARPHLRLADALAATGDAAGAAESLRRAMELAPADPAVQMAVARSALANRRPADALQAARKLQARDKAAGFNLEAEIEATQGHWAAAAAAYNRALADTPTTDTALRLHGALVAAGKAEDAERMAAEWRKAHPDDQIFVLKLADAAMARRQPAQAELLYREVLARRPGHLLALNNLAYALATQKKPGAVAAAQEAVRLAPDIASFRDTLAFSLAADNQYPQAVEAQVRAVELAPAVPQYRLQLARLQLRVGEKDAAIFELERLEKLGKEFARQPEVRALLAQARG